jgi:signal transduction histidine kinase
MVTTCRSEVADRTGPEAGPPRAALTWLTRSASGMNTGPVIPPDQVDRLFQPFHRLRSRTSHGHGLGLSIVHAIATAHGATVTAQALPQGGLAINVTFPPPGRAAGQPARRGIASGA